MRPGAILLAAVLAISAGRALAQNPPAPAKPADSTAPIAAQDPTSTVAGVAIPAPEGPALSLPEIVDRFVSAHSATTRVDHLSRWAQPVCPQVGGLSEPFDAFVAARIVTVATSVGVPPDKSHRPCRTNLLVVFTTQPQALMDDVGRRHSAMLGFHYAAQTRRLTKVDHPLQAWYLTGTRNGATPAEPDDEFHRTPGGCAGSRFSDCLRSEFLGVLVVVDANRIEGHQIGAIADSVAMLALSHATAVHGCASLPTILDFLNPNCPVAADPSGLTAYDLAYLKGLYSVNAEEFSKAQRSEIGSRILREVKNTPATP